MQDERKMAFWSYDVAPFVLSGEVLDVREDGAVSVKGYSGYFKPEVILKIVSFNDGVKLQNKLIKMEREYHRTIEREKKKFRSFISTYLS